MPTEHISYSYGFEELSDAAKKRAIQVIGEKLSGPWFDSHNVDDLRDSAVWAFADVVGEPRAHEFGTGDYPGIPGVSLDGFDFSPTQGQHVAFSGRLTRDNAPKLPWVDGIDSVELTALRSSTRVWVESAEDIEPTTTEIQTMRDAVTDALHKAFRAGQAEYDYIGSDENAREFIEGNEPQFTEDGHLFG